MPTAIQPATQPAGDSFLDVRAACHNWLMKKDPAYRKNRENWEAKETSRKTRKAARFAARSALFED